MDDEVVGSLWCFWGKQEIYIGLCWGGPKCFLKNLDGEAWTSLFVMGQGEMPGCYKYSYELSGFLNCRGVGLGFLTK
jgi:hypothetical protein